ncbi:site-specific integrase [Moraxella ovis]|uniref:site-specific integrase n=1 Tax=Moraxella ovis TaxID=29433 RepID=UPI000D86D068|nr:site-specific integrase [Moraxella ovis]SPX82038.1 Uncharacterised protein [Moraxella ovis]STZ05703.1 Uncharacterised protein [Moraxella ovis]
MLNNLPTYETEVVNESSNDHNLYEQSDIRYSLMGYVFTLNDDVWKLSSNISINWKLLESVENIHPDVKVGLRQIIAEIATNNSAFYALNSFNEIKNILLKSPYYDGGIITANLFLNIRAHIIKNNVYILGKVRTVLKKWEKLGFIGIETGISSTLDKLTIEGMLKGRAVRTKDAFKGAYTVTEKQSLMNWASNAFKDNILSLEEFTLFCLLMCTGRRPIQISMLRQCDVLVKNNQGKIEYGINIPRAKQKYSFFRQEFRELYINEDLYLVLKSQMQFVQKFAIQHIKNLEQDDLSQLPVFINKENFLSVKSISEFRNKLKYQPDFFHITSSRIDSISKKIKGECRAVSERTGGYINFFPYRARRTLGTDLARQGIGGVQIAYLLDHTDTQNVSVYTEDTIEQSLRIFEAMDKPMNRLVDMFSGRIIRNESEAIRGDDISSRKFKNDGKQLGNCGGSPACQNGIKACLICTSFQPLLGADWKGLLEDLNQDRLFQSKNGASELVLSSYDLPLANASAIMRACNKILMDESYV